MSEINNNNNSLGGVSDTKQQNDDMLQTPTTNLLPKRLRDLTNDVHLNSKTPKLTEYESPRLWQLMDQKLARQTEVITAQIASQFNVHLVELEKKILGKLDAVQAGLNAVTNRVSELEEKIPQIEELKAEINSIKLKLQDQENSLVASDIRINGIPKYDNEDLFVLFDTICKSIQHSTPTVKQIFRIYNKFLHKSVIIVKLESPFAKSQLLKAIARYRRANNSTLRLSNAGFNSNIPIFINECLSKLNHAIFVAAYNLKKQKQLFSVFSIRGIVHVKRSSDDTPILVDTMQKLEQIKLFRVENIHNNNSTNNNENQLRESSMPSNNDIPTTSNVIV